MRHGVTRETGTLLTGRLPGVGLSDTGQAAARSTAEQLIDAKWAAAYTSPVQRCRETATIVASPHGLRPTVERRFIEADYGRWSGRQLKSLYKLKAWGDLMRSASRFRFPDGETLGEVQARAVAALENVAAHHPKDDVLIVSHSDVIRSLICNYLGIPLDLIHRIHVSPTSLTIIELYKGGMVRVPVVNQTFPEPKTSVGAADKAASHG